MYLIWSLATFDSKYVFIIANCSVYILLWETLWLFFQDWKIQLSDCLQKLRSRNPIYSYIVLKTDMYTILFSIHVWIYMCTNVHATCVSRAKQLEKANILIKLMFWAAYFNQKCMHKHKSENICLKSETFHQNSIKIGFLASELRTLRWDAATFERRLQRVAPV